MNQQQPMSELEVHSMDTHYQGLRASTWKAGGGRRLGEHARLSMVLDWGNPCPMPIHFEQPSVEAAYATRRQDIPPLWRPCLAALEQAGGSLSSSSKHQEALLPPPPPPCRESRLQHTTTPGISPPQAWHPATNLRREAFLASQDVRRGKWLACLCLLW